MRLKYLLIAIPVLAAGCNKSGRQAPETGESKAAPNPETSNPEPPGQPAKAEAKAKGQGKAFWQPLAWHEYRDNTGAVFASMPFPSDWKVATKSVPGEPSITGPHGIKISDYPLQSFIYTNDPNMQMIYRQSGQNLRPMPGIDQVIQQDIAPRLAEKGFRYVRHYEIPEVTKIDRWYNDQLYKVAPSQIEIAAFGSEWKTDDGKPYFVLLHLNVNTTAQMQMWSYYCNSLSSDAAYFEKARKQLVFALGNTHYPIGPIMAYNQREAEKAGQSWAAHNRRMAQNQANFEAQQRAFVNKSNAINDAIMGGYRARDASGDKQQERTIDGIYERTNAMDPTTGQKYKVEAGANKYWMNGDGEYISTDKQTYDPNLDDNMNALRWQELQEVK